MPKSIPGGYPETPVCLWLVPSDQLPQASIRVPSLPGDYLTMAGMLAFARALADAGAVPGFTEQADALLDRFRASNKITELGSLLPLATAATLGVTRRITRESHDSAVVIDALARRLASVLAAEDEHLDVVVHDLQHWDRPSIRTLYRCCLLSAGRLRVHAGMTPEHTKSLVGEHRLAWFAGLAAQPGVEAAVDWDAALITDPVPPASPWDALYADSFGTALLELGNALAYQNFERVFLLLDAAARADLPIGERLEVERIRGIAEAQIGDLDAALVRLDRTRLRARTPQSRAHLGYLVGLLYTKREFDADRAGQLYRDGLDGLTGLPDDEDVVVERCWLRNGLALLNTMRARTAAPAEAEELKAGAFELCFAALRDVRPYRSEAALYLRFNLVANIAFLLEIVGRPAEAVRFWQGAFGGLADAGSEQFAVAYWCRLGQLRAKAGEHDAAADAFERAVTACGHTGDLFYLERVHDSWANAATRAGDSSTAAEQHRIGARLAADLRDRKAYRSHLAGLAHSLASAGDLDALHDLVAAVPDWPAALATDLARVSDTADPSAGSDADLGAVLTAHGVAVVPPSPKLPPYIPSVDLEGDGTRDLNRMLVTAPAAARG